MHTALPEHTAYSPDEMLQEAREIMLKMILDITYSNEKRVLELLYAASTYPNMSKYHLSMTRIILGDLYFSHEIYGSAYQHYELALRDYPKAPVKRKLSKLEKIKASTPNKYFYSLDPYIKNTDICYHPPK